MPFFWRWTAWSESSSPTLDVFFLPHPRPISSATCRDPSSTWILQRAQETWWKLYWWKLYNWVRKELIHWIFLLKRLGFLSLLGQIGGSKSLRRVTMHGRFHLGYFILVTQTSWRKQQKEHKNILGRMSMISQHLSATAAHTEYADLLTQLICVLCSARTPGFQ